MGIYNKRRDLDQWADAFGVRNDDDAATECYKLLGRLTDAHSRLRGLGRMLSKAPDDEMRKALATAIGRLDLACTATGEALRGFANHERG